jgi:serine/threonine protein kinase/WD40 repeat protein
LEHAIMLGDSVLLGELAEEFAQQVRKGLMPDLEEYARRHPALAERIRVLFPTLLLLEGMAGGAASTDAGHNGAALARGNTFGAYRVEREIGRGGMGVVYEAVHLTLNRRVALKVLPVQGPGQARQLERFLREAQTAAGLHHTNIVPVFDVGQVHGTPYYAMQFIDGRGLDRLGRPATEGDPDRTTDLPANAPSAVVSPTTPSRSATGGADHFPWVAEVGAQAAEGLAYAHERGVIHRDIKPSNLLLDERGVVWITDFGLARRLDDVALTHTGVLVGTPRYMSPEQAEAAKRPVDHRTDVYSLGATLYELLTRRPAFDGRTPQELVGQILGREPVPPRRLDRKIPRDLETIVLKAMAKRPEDRYPNAAELATDLRRFLALEPIRARRIGIMGRSIRWSRRNPAVAALLATVALSLLGGAAVATIFAWKADRAAQVAQSNADEAIAANKRSRRLLYAACTNLAFTALQDNRIGRLRELLDETRPGEGEEDLRGFEWHYLWRSFHSGKRIASFAGIDPVLSANGTRLAVFETPSFELRVYDTDTRRQLFARKLASGFRNYALSADGRIVAQWTTEDVVTLWDVDSGRERTRLKPGNNLRSVVFDSRGHRVAVPLITPEKDPGIGYETAVQVWNLATNQRECILATGRCGLFDTIACAFSPDGASLACVVNDRLALWDLATGRKRFTLPARVDNGRLSTSRFEKAAAFSPDSRRLAVVGDGTKDVKVWDALTNRKGSKTITVWNVTTGRKERSLPGYADEITNVQFSPDGRYLAVADGIGAVTLSDLDSKQPLQILRREGDIDQLVFRAGGRRLLSKAGGVLDEWELFPPQIRRLSGCTRDGFVKASLSPDGRRLAAVLSHRQAGWRLHVWDTATARELCSLPGVQLSPDAFVWSPDSRRVALHANSASIEGLHLPSPCAGLAGLIVATATSSMPADHIEIWDVETVRRLSWFPHRGVEDKLDFSPDGRHLLEVKSRGWKLWDAATGEVRLAMKAAPAVLDHTAFSPDGKRLAVIRQFDPDNQNSQTELTLWNLTSYQREFTQQLKVPGGGRERIHIRFRADGKHLAFTTSSTIWEGDPWRLELHVYDVSGREAVPVWKWETGTTQADFRRPLVFSPDGRLLALGNSDEVVIWDLTSDELPQKLRGHLRVGAIDFIPDGRLLTLSDDGRRQEVKVWDLRTGQELMTVPLGPALESILPEIPIPHHFDGRRLTVTCWREEGFGELRTLDGTPVP